MHSNPQDIHSCRQVSPITSDRGRRSFFVCIAAMTGILIAVLVSLTPAGADDLLFLLPAKGSQPGMALSEMMIGEFPRIWQTQSGRLGNFLSMPFLYLMPKWIFGIITGVLTFLLIILSSRIAAARYGSVVSWLLYAAIVLAFPWYDYLTLVTYAINYLWAAVAAVAAIACFLSISRFHGVRMALACLLMFVAGWLHEGFGAPLTAGLTLCILFHRKEAGWRRILAWISAGAGTCMTFLSPVFWQRSERETNFLLKFTYKELIMQIGPASVFIVAMLVLLIWISCRRDIRKKLLLSPTLLVSAGAALAATAVFLKFFTGPRTGAPPILYSAIACAYMISSVTRRLRVGAGWQWMAGILIGGFSIAHLVYADILQKRSTEEYHQVTRLYEDSVDGTFFFDVSYPKADLSLFKTSVRQFHEKVPKEFMRMYFNPGHPMVILPTSMRGFSPGKARPSRLTPGAMIFNGWAVLPDSIETQSFSRIHILTEKGEYLPSRFRTDRFNCPGIGTFILLTPHIKVLDSNLQVKDIALYDNSR